MSFGGAIDAMIRSYQSNVGWLRRKRISDQNLLYKRSNKQGEETKPLDEKQKQWVSNYIKEYKRQEHIRKRIVIGFTIIISMVILYYILTADYSGLIEILT